MNPQASRPLNYETDLNSEQYAAVTMPGGPVLIIAGAGSGKTRTIVYRVAWLIESGIPPESILLLTFTRKAAEEMLARVSELLGSQSLDVSGGTFHSTANYLLRRYASMVGWGQGFSIMDQTDSIEAVDFIKGRLGLSKDELKKLPKSRTIREIISKSINMSLDIESALHKYYSHFAEHTDIIEDIRMKYHDHKRSNNSMDYDDLLVNFVDLLESNEPLRRKVSETWRHILVDEYQDTNALQARIVRLTAYTHDNVMVVGDDSQSIYSFRGANYENIINFPKLFQGARVIKLEQNYRSTAPILRITNTIIEKAVEGFPKRLFTEIAGGPLPMCARTSDERRQSNFVVKCVNELFSHGIPLKEIAVLFRAGFHSFELEGELSRSGVPFVKYGGSKFLEAQHIKDVLAYLKIVNNPRDSVSWIRVLKMLPGVGPKTAMKLAEDLGKGVPNDLATYCGKNKKCGANLHEVLTNYIEWKEFSGPLGDLVAKVNQYYYTFLQSNFDNYPKRMRDLDTLADMTAQYSSLDKFLNETALDPPDILQEDQFGLPDKLTLSTIHSAKGLEWHTVILIWAIEGRLPSVMAMNSPEDLEEERRLVYVAATRAKRNLVIVYPEMYLDRSRGMVGASLSRFFDEVPKDYFREHYHY